MYFFALKISISKGVVEEETKFSLLYSFCMTCHSSKIMVAGDKMSQWEVRQTVEPVTYPLAVSLSLARSLSLSLSFFLLLLLLLPNWDGMCMYAFPRREFWLAVDTPVYVRVCPVETERAQFFCSNDSWQVCRVKNFWFRPAFQLLCPSKRFQFYLWASCEGFLRWFVTFRITWFWVWGTSEVREMCNTVFALHFWLTYNQSCHWIFFQGDL